MGVRLKDFVFSQCYESVGVAWAQAAHSSHVSEAQRLGAAAWLTTARVGGRCHTDTDGCLPYTEIDDFVYGVLTAHPSVKAETKVRRRFFLRSIV